jgi:hypothetical protein
LLTKTHKQHPHLSQINLSHALTPNLVILPSTTRSSKCSFLQASLHYHALHDPPSRELFCDTRGVTKVIYRQYYNDSSVAMIWNEAAVSQGVIYPGMYMEKLRSTTWNPPRQLTNDPAEFRTSQLTNAKLEPFRCTKPCSR